MTNEPRSFELLTTLKPFDSCFALGLNPTSKTAKFGMSGHECAVVKLTLNPLKSSQDFFQLPSQSRATKTTDIDGR